MTEDALWFPTSRPMTWSAYLKIPPATPASPAASSWKRPESGSPALRWTILSSTRQQTLLLEPQYAVTLQFWSCIDALGRLYLFKPNTKLFLTASVWCIYYAALYLMGKFFVICSVSVFSHRFLLTDADLFVLTYLEANADNIPPQTLESVRRKLNVDGTNDRAWAQMGTEDQT